MYNHLYQWQVKTEGEFSLNEVEVLPHLPVKLGGEEGFSWRKGCITTVVTGGVAGLEGEDAGETEGHVEGVR